MFVMEKALNSKPSGPPPLHASSGFLVAQRVTLCLHRQSIRPALYLQPDDSPGRQRTLTCHWESNPSYQDVRWTKPDRSKPGVLTTRR
ncbi:hypothetical protein PGT21_012289 [Puccinia graminis f. sp. tritici]|uniref:Ig-like domain-containing protein n=1 Tax=Puccinia graminis f. sp. tritici TaxID=56615 RepID=A0A5B0MCN3_PUCGR|nr:hypothetical protein PGTUg99_005868 [Puccinia graminis f. sp. tritici]KAA1090738.1 hypothetical protein PGT21_012289 [Puccinia graminis f. sp. tritici]